MGTVILSPGSMVRLRDVDNLRVLATKKGLLLQAADNGRQTLHIAWNGKAKLAKAAASLEAKSVAASAKSLAGTAKTLSATAKTLGSNAEPVAAAAAAKTGLAAVKALPIVAAKGAVAATSAGVGLTVFGPLLAASTLISAAGLFLYVRNRRTDELYE